MASGKGGVGKSTIASEFNFPGLYLPIPDRVFDAVNLAFALSLRKNRHTKAPLRVGILDLDIFGPSIPTLMGLQNAGEPALTARACVRYYE